MAGSGIRSIDGSFIRGLSAFSSSSSGSANALTGGSSSAASSTFSGLRTGAKTYSLALQSLNGVISAVSIAKSTLEELSTITDKLIDLADRAAKSSTGSATRTKLDREFKVLATDFREMVGRASLGDDELLTKEGFANVLALVGLSEEESASIAEIFEKFSLPDGAASFADEELKGKRPIRIPAAAFPTGVTSNNPTLQHITQLSDANGSGSIVTSALISQVNNVVRTDEDPVFEIAGNTQNPDDVETIVTYQTDGTVNQLPLAPTGNNTLLAVSEQSGYTLFASNEDYLGYNVAGFSQVYLADNTGKILQQVTATLTADVSYESADLSADGLTVSVLATNATANENYILAWAYPEHGINPFVNIGVAVEATASTALFDFDELKISEDGNYIAYRVTDVTGLFSTAGDNSIFLRDRNLTLDFSLIGPSERNLYSEFDFVGSGRLGLYNPTDGANGSIATYTYGFGSINHAEDRFLDETALFVDFSEVGSGRAAFITAGNNIYDVSLDDAFEDWTINTISSLGVPTGFSVAQNSAGGLDFGIVADYGDIAGVEAGENLHRLNGAIFTTVNAVSSVSSPEADKVLDGSLRKRPESYRTKVDLVALKEQIEKNIEALDFAAQKLIGISDAVRLAGLAMLDLSNQIGTSEDAESVANKLQLLLRQRGGSDIAEYGDTLVPIAQTLLASEED